MKILHHKYTLWSTHRASIERSERGKASKQFLTTFECSFIWKTKPRQSYCILVLDASTIKTDLFNIQILPLNKGFPLKRRAFNEGRWFSSFTLWIWNDIMIIKVSLFCVHLHVTPFPVARCGQRYCYSLRDGIVAHCMLQCVTKGKANLVYIESTPSAFSILYRKEASSRNRKSNSVFGGGISILELRREIRLRYSKIAKCLNTFVVHCSPNLGD